MNTTKSRITSRVSIVGFTKGHGTICMICKDSESYRIIGGRTMVSDNLNIILISICFKLES